jgi:hypothetical protein
MQTTTWLAICLLVVGGVAFASIGAVKPTAKDAPTVNFGTRPDYGVADVQKIINSKENMARRYIVPMLWPVDLITPVGLGVGAALLCMVFAPWAQPGLKSWTLLLAILPLAYMISDITENIALTFMLSGSPEAVTQERIDVVHAITRIKIGLFILAGLQTAGLPAAWLLGLLRTAGH